MAVGKCLSKSRRYFYTSSPFFKFCVCINFKKSDSAVEGKTQRFVFKLCVFMMELQILAL